MKTVAMLFFALATASPLAAQPWYDTPPVSVRPFFLVSGQQFAAKETFDAVFEQSIQRFWGGGVQVAFGNGLFVDVTASRFRKTGERAFVFDDEVIRLGIPLTATVTPFEIAAGYRFRLGEAGKIRPYAGAGFGTYHYQEESAFADPDDEGSPGGNVDARHSGFLMMGGIEYRAHPWVGLSVDAQYSHVSGILGEGGISQEMSEDDLGGTAVRFRVIVGK
jgi:hypothetical protein